MTFTSTSANGTVTSQNVATAKIAIWNRVKLYNIAEISDIMDAFDFESEAVESQVLSFCRGMLHEKKEAATTFLSN